MGFSIVQLNRLRNRHRSLYWRGNPGRGPNAIRRAVMKVSAPLRFKLRSPHVAGRIQLPDEIRGSYQPFVSTNRLRTADREVSRLPPYAFGGLLQSEHE